MAVFRIERTKDYTVMSNHHLRNHELSLKAKGLLSMMLSLPDDWNYTMLIDFVQDESHSVLVSSHITSDLEKVADYITFIHKGNLIFTHEKDNLIDNYGILNCGAAVFDTLDKTEVVAYRKEDYQFKVLVKDRNKAAKQYANAIVGPATIEEIMLFYVKGEMQ